MDYAAKIKILKLCFAYSLKRFSASPIGLFADKEKA